MECRSTDLWRYSTKVEYSNNVQNDITYSTGDNSTTSSCVCELDRGSTVRADFSMILDGIYSPKLA